MSDGKRRKNEKRWKRRNARKKNGRDSKNSRGRNMKGRSDENAKIKRGERKKRLSARKGEKKRTKRRENVTITDGSQLRIIYIPLLRNLRIRSLRPRCRSSAGVRHRIVPQTRTLSV